MKVKLTPVVSKYRNVFVIEGYFMHGDADAYSTEKYECEDEADYIRIMSQADTIPDRHDDDEDALEAWCTELFGDDFLPVDCTCDDYVAELQSLEGFFYDADGKKFNVTLVE